MSADDRPLWTRKPVRNIHITVREPDMQGFDPRRFVATLVDLKCNFVSLLTAGYHCIYRSEIALNRVNPYLGEGDPLGDVVRLAHESSIKVGACVDVAAVPRPVYDHYPEWFMKTASGGPHIVTAHPVELYIACPIGGYLENFILPVVREHLERYDFDHFNLTGFGFGAYGSGICHCHNCVREYREASGREIPAGDESGSENWKTYMKWREVRIIEQYRRMIDAIRKAKPGIATWINQAYDISERAFAPMQALSELQDFVKTEAQTKVYFDDIDGEVHLPPMWFAGEEGRYFNTITDRKVITTTSYYFPWPWRMNAAPEAMEKMWIAEAAANNVNPFVHISGFPQMVEDRRGMKAVRDMFHFLADNEKYYDGVRSYVNVAVVLSNETLDMYAGDHTRQRYGQHYRGVYSALAESHIVFDIIPDSALSSAKGLEKYGTLVVPNAAAMSDGSASALREFVRGGGGLVATYETSLFTEEGAMRKDFALADVFGCRLAGDRLGPLAGTVEGAGRIMSYMRLAAREHPVLEGIGDTDVLPNAGFLRLTRALPDAEVFLTGQLPARVFPEGEAWVAHKDTDIPAAIAHRFGKGKVVFFPAMVDRLYERFGYPDHRRLIANAVRWALDYRDIVRLEAPVTVDLMLQAQPEQGRVIVHLINLTGKRPQSETVPVHDLKLQVRLASGSSPKRVLRASSGASLPFGFSDGMVSVAIDRLDIYDLVVIETR